MATAHNVAVELDIKKLTFRQQAQKVDAESTDEEVILLRSSPEGDASLVSVSKGPSKLEKKLLNFSWHHVSAISTSLQVLKLGKVFIECDEKNKPKETRINYIIVEIELKELPQLETIIKQFGLVDCLLDERKGPLGTVLLSPMVERHYSRSLRVSWKLILFVWEILLFFALMCQLADRLLPVTLNDLEQSVGHMSDWASHALKKMDKFFMKFKARHPVIYIVLFLFLLALWPFAWVWWLVVFAGTKLIPLTIVFYSAIHVFHALHVFLLAISSIKKQSSYAFLVYSGLRWVYNLFTKKKRGESTNKLPRSVSNPMANTTASTGSKTTSNIYPTTQSSPLLRAKLNEDKTD